MPKWVKFMHGKRQMPIMRCFCTGYDECKQEERIYAFGKRQMPIMNLVHDIRNSRKEM